MKTTCLILISFLISLPILGQNPLITNYTIKDGLPSNTVYTSYQDSKGFIWFGTDSGVTKFNGEKFETYSMNDGMSCNEILDIKEDCYGRVWFMNLNGTLNFYKNNTIFNEQNAPFLGEMKCDEFWLDFYQSQDSTLFFYNYKSDIVGLQNYDKIIIKKRLLNPKLQLEYLNMSENGIFQLWTKENIYRFKDLSKNHTGCITYPENKTLGIFPAGRNETIYLGNTMKYYIYSDTTIVSVRTSSLNPKYTVYILIDNEGGLWVSKKDNGIHFYHNKKYIPILNIKQSQNILQDRDNNIWISSAMNGVFKLGYLVTKTSHIGVDNFQNQGILAITSKIMDGVWITNGSTLFLIKKNNIYPLKIKPDNKILNQIVPYNGNNLIIHGNNTIYYIIKDIKLNTKTLSIETKSIRHNMKAIKKIIVAQSFNKLFSYQGDHINIGSTIIENSKRIDPNRGRINNIFYDTKNQLIINASGNYIYGEDTIVPCKELETLNGEIILSHLILNKNNEIYNVNGQELYLLNNSGLYNLSEKLEYPINLAIKHISDSGNLLFFSTIRNIYLIPNPLDVIDGKELKITKLSVDFNNINDIECQDSVIHIASDDGLTTIPIQVFLDEQEIAPKPYIDNILVDNKDYDYFNGMVTCRSDQRINIDYSAINFSSSVPIFNYMLEGIDKDWVSSSDKKVSYQNLKPGNYTFRLKASKNGKLFSGTIELPVTITPTFFQKTFVKIILFLIIAVLAYLFQIALYRRKTRKKEIESQLVNLENKALQSMMNPHFIFNALGSIQRYLLQNKATEAGTYLSQFARLIRQNMNSLKSNFISIDDELERLRNYIELEQFRMNNKFAYKIEVDEKIDGYETSIPSMVIQPFVENAIWHGITPLPTDGLVTVRFAYLDEKSIQIIIEDNGVGISKTNPVTKSDQNLNLGMDLTRKRISLIGEKMKVATSLYSEDINPVMKNPGTRITIIVPATFEE